MEHGLQVTSGVSSCNTRKMKVVNANTPLRERALCQYEYVLNYKPNVLSILLCCYICHQNQPCLENSIHFDGSTMLLSSTFTFGHWKEIVWPLEFVPNLNNLRIFRFECQPLRYQVRVLLFDEQCSTYVEETETISMACITVLQVLNKKRNRGRIIKGSKSNLDRKVCWCFLFVSWLT